jgi:hypothetical protein
MIKLPYARADFGPMRHEKCFYVDRTSYLEQLEVYAPVYTMFLRPRRFGKSLWISISYLAIYTLDGIQHR